MGNQVVLLNRFIDFGLFEKGLISLYVYNLEFDQGSNLKYSKYSIIVCKNFNDVKFFDFKTFTY